MANQLGIFPHRLYSFLEGGDPTTLQVSAAETIGVSFRFRLRLQVA